MRHKKSIFLLYLFAPVFSGLFWTCQMDKKNTVLLATIRDGQAVLSDSTTVAIPHYGDTAYIIFYCIRHAEKRKDQGNNPSLTPEGEARATRLGKIMAAVHVDRACSTTFKRTVQTAEAIRREMPEPPAAETYPADMQDAWLDGKLKEGGGKQYLVVGHQNTIPQLLNRLKGGTEFQNIPENEFGRFYIAVTKGIGQTEVVELRY